MDKQAKLQGVVIPTESDDESPVAKKDNAVSSKQQEEDEKELTKEELSLCVSPYQRYDHDFGTHHVRLKKIEQWKKADGFAKKELVPKSSRAPLNLKILMSGITLK